MSAVVDENLDVDLKEEMVAWLEYRDGHVVEQLRSEGCAFAALPLARTVDMLVQMNDPEGVDPREECPGHSLNAS